MPKNKEGCSFRVTPDNKDQIVVHYQDSEDKKIASFAGSGISGITLCKHPKMIGEIIPGCIDKTANNPQECGIEGVTVAHILHKIRTLFSTGKKES